MVACPRSLRRSVSLRIALRLELELTPHARNRQNYSGWVFSNGLTIYTLCGHQYGLRWFNVDQSLAQFGLFSLWEALLGCGSKLNRRGYAGFGPCFHLPGFHFGHRLFEPLPFLRLPFFSATSSQGSICSTTSSLACTGPRVSVASFSRP